MNELLTAIHNVLPHFINSRFQYDNGFIFCKIKPSEELYFDKKLALTLGFDLKKFINRRDRVYTDREIEKFKGDLDHGRKFTGIPFEGFNSESFIRGVKIPQTDQERKAIKRINLKNDQIIIAKRGPDVRASSYNMYIYCNMVEPSLVGTDYVPLLNIVALEDEHGKYLSKEFLSPHYVRLQTGFIPNIEIKLCDDTGENIKFQWGKVVVKIHFRYNGENKMHKGL